MSPTAARYEGMYMWADGTSRLPAGVPSARPQRRACRCPSLRGLRRRTRSGLGLASAGLLLDQVAEHRDVGRCRRWRSPRAGAWPTRLLNLVLVTLALVFMAITVRLARSRIFLAASGSSMCCGGRRPVPGSTRGAYLLVAYTGLVCLYGLAEWFGDCSALFGACVGWPSPEAVWPRSTRRSSSANVKAAISGRRRSCRCNLLVQSWLASAAVLALLAPLSDQATQSACRSPPGALAGGLVVRLLVTRGDVLHAAARPMRPPMRYVWCSKVRSAALFWGGTVLLGGLLPAALLAVGWGHPGPVALAGLSGAGRTAGL